MVEMFWVMDHVEVLLNGKFLFSADTMTEARHELEEMEAVQYGDS